MHHLLRKQVILPVVFVLSCVSQLHAQQEIYRRNHDDLVYYFGLTLGYNYSYLHLTKSPAFLQNDSILSAEPGTSGGIAMGLLATARLDDHFQFRVNPQLIIGGSRYITYTQGKWKPGESQITRQILPTTIVSFPFQVKFNSDRIGNFRTYMLGGIKLDTDLSSNSSARNAEDIIKMTKGDIGFELGLGFNFYLPFVTISPEIKISNGLKNIHLKDPSLKYSNVLDQILSRMVVFSIHFED